MSDSRLLPTGSSPLEVAAAKACAEIEKTPVSIRELWNPDTCPANLLPWLAWSFSVDRWDDTWPEATKRAVIRDAYFIHCHKGTIGAIRRVVEPLGYLIEVREWWQLNEERGRSVSLLACLSRVLPKKCIRSWSVSLLMQNRQAAI